MKSITVTGLTIQFDSHHEIENIEEYVRSSLELINLSLQREPYDLSAQLLGTWEVNSSQVSVEDIQEEEAEDV